MEAIGNVYDYLRQAETSAEATRVLIVDIDRSRLDGGKKFEGEEHRGALYDRLFRAVSGQAIAYDPITGNANMEAC